MTEYEQLVRQGRAAVIRRNRSTAAYQAIRRMVNVWQWSTRSRQPAACHACGVIDETRHMHIVYDTYDGDILRGIDFLDIWRTGRPLQFVALHYCEPCYTAMVTS